MAKPIEVLLMQGRRSANFPMSQREAGVNAFAFTDIISSARRAIEWQLLLER